jgi:signal transduction histidine kinase
MSKPLSVLMVEDSENDAELLQIELRRQGLAPTVMRVDTGPALRAALLGRAWDVVISDHNMPSFSGDEALKIVKQYAPDLPFIVVSGTRSEEEAVEAMRAGASDFIVKTRLHRLAPVIERELQDSALRAEQRRMANALAESQQQLRQAQKLEAVGRLAGGVAHDFNNLLTAIRGYSDLVLASLPADNPIAGDVLEIQRAADRAASLTQQLLAFSRKQILQPRVLDMNSVVSTVEPMLQRLIGEDITIASSCSARGYVVADPGQIEQILVNLVVNARDAMPQGGTISIETQNATLDETYTSEHAPVVPGRYVMLAVGDNGVGMSRDTREHAFDPFFTTKEAGKGTGLGLATVYGIVKQSGGYVWIYSEPGLGTTLKLYFPEVSAAAAFTNVEYKPSAKLGARGSETILLVEDEESVRGLTSRILEKQGYRVIVAQHGREAMDIATREVGHIDLVLTDIVMPGMNGRGLVERLAGIRPRIKSLYMSGYTDDDIIRRGFIEPSKSFLQKPFTSESLLQTVRKVLDEG